MRAINKQATKVMDRLTDGLNIENTAKKIDNANGTFMAVHVDWINTVPDGELYAVAHYYEHNGDLMCDSLMTFLKSILDGRYYPIDYRLDGLGIMREIVIFDRGNNIVGCYIKEQRDAAIFAGQWMMDIMDQQGISIKQVADEIKINLSIHELSLIKVGMVCMICENELDDDIRTEFEQLIDKITVIKNQNVDPASPDYCRGLLGNKDEYMESYNQEINNYD